MEKILKNLSHIGIPYQQKIYCVDISLYPYIVVEQFEAFTES